MYLEEIAFYMGIGEQAYFDSYRYECVLEGDIGFNKKNENIVPITKINEEEIVQSYSIKKGRKKYIENLKIIL